MKLVTKEEIIAKGIQIVKDFYNEVCSVDNIKVERWDVVLLASKKGSYKHLGWGVWLYPIEPSEIKFYALDFLQDGTPVAILSEDKEELTANREIYIYMNEEGVYKPIGRDEYFEHHTFPFEDKALFTFKPY